MFPITNSTRRETIRPLSQKQHQRENPPPPPHSTRRLRGSQRRLRQTDPPRSRLCRPGHPKRIIQVFFRIWPTTDTGRTTLSSKVEVGVSAQSTLVFVEQPHGLVRLQTVRL